MMASTDDTAFENIIGHLSAFTGTDFSKYKRSTLERRLKKRMLLTGNNDIQTYSDFIYANRDEAHALFQDLLIGVTTFFRDDEPFALVRECLKELIDRKGEGDSLRIWSVGTATGEEAYSVAILVHQLLTEAKKNLHVQIFASDIDDKAIAFARKAVYPANQLEGVEDALVKTYFEKEGDHYHVIGDLKKWLLFARHDITVNPPFVKTDLIVCRNLLIYFNQHLQKEVLATFHYSLREDGFLFLGKSETISTFSDLFIPIDNQHKIFRKNNNVLSNAYNLPHFRPSTSGNLFRPTTSKKEDHLHNAIKEVFYHSFEHPFAVVNKQYEVLNIHGSLRLYLDVKGNLKQLNLLEMVNPELKLELRSLFHKVKNSGMQAKSRMLNFELFDQPHHVKLHVKPVINEEQGFHHYIVVFEKPDEVAALDGSNGTQSNGTGFSELEQELVIAREQIQAYAQELEAREQELQVLNEELQSTNEELKSSNEELETSNEELQASNEELRVSNDELKSLNDQLQEKEGLLLQTHNQWTSLFENSNEIIAVIDDEGRVKNINHINPKVAAMGYQKSDFIGSLYWEFIDREQQNVLKEHYHKVMTSGETVSFEVKTRLSGTIFNFRYIPLKRNDKIEGIMSFGSDVTEKRQYEEMTYFLNMASRELMGKLNLSDGLDKITQLVVPRLADWFTIDILNDEGQFELLKVAHKDPEKVEWARQYREQKPVDPDAPTGSAKVVRTGESEYYPEISDELLTAVAQSEEELELLRSIGFASAITVPLKLPGRIIGVMSFISTTESNRKYTQNDLLQAEEFAKLVALTIENSRLFQMSQRSESRFRTMADSAPVFIWMANPDKELIYFNRGWLEYTGTRLSDQLGDGWRDAVYPEDLEHCIAAFNDAFDKREEFTLEYRLGRHDGTYRWILDKGIPLFDSDTNFTGYIGACIDIHENKMVDEKKDEFISVASHELRTPLAAVKGYLQVLMRQKENLAAGAQLLLEKANLHSNHLNDLIHDLLDISRIQGGKLEFKFGPVKVKELVQESREEFNFSYPDYEVAVVGATNATVQGDKMRLAQVIQNFLSNAVKYGGQSRRIELHVNEDAEFIKIGVRDFGIGLEKSDVKRVFDKFYRVQNSSHISGLGVGLFICNEIINRHGGEIGVESELGKGSTFYFRIPKPQEKK